MNYFVCMVLFFCSSLLGQIVFEDERGSFDSLTKTSQIVSGYVKYEFYGDSRQVIALMAGHELYNPEKPSMDIFDNDIHKRGQFEMNAIESRLRYNLKTERMKNLNVPVEAILEADFWGLLTADRELPGGFRLRHAYIEIQGKNTKVLFGYTWHPITILDCYPDTISFNGGAPYEAASRNPVVVVTLQYKENFIIFGACSQLNFTSDGPDGYSNTYARNGIMPDFHLQLKRKHNKHTYGIGYDIKRISPRIQTEKNISVYESLISHTAFVYYSYFHEHFSLCTKYIFSENGTDYGVYGGYGVHMIDPITDKRIYANIATSNYWIDIAMHINELCSPGIFVGYSYNHGSQKIILHDQLDVEGVVLERMVYGYEPDLGKSFRVQPRLRIKCEPVCFCLELEMTAVTFGNRDEFAKIENQKWVSNTRFLCGLFYTF